MPFPPIQPSDPFELAGKAFDALPNLDSSSRELPGFGAPNLPSMSGTGIRQNSVPNERGAVFTRNMIRWFVPEVGIVEMYINPQQISYQYKKQISNQRTRGGYSLQYWGEELTPLSITGTTGSSGIEGINVLYDIYRAEQNAYDPYALAIASDLDAENDIIGAVFDNNILDAVSGTFDNLLNNAIESGAPTTSRPKPTLASLAFSVEMYYSGWVYRGYFTDFRVDERADKLGLFDYTMTFMSTQRRGMRNNFLGWHRSAVNGPSISDPEFGRPYSYRGLYSEQFTPPNVQSSNSGLSLLDALETGASLVGSAVSAPFTAFSSIF